MKYVLLVVLLLVGCGEEKKPTGQVVFPQHEEEAKVAEAPVQPAAEPAKVEEPKLSDAEIAAQDAKDWDDALAAIKKLSAQDISNLNLEDEVQHVYAHFAAQKLTDREKELLGVQD